MRFSNIYVKVFILTAIISIISLIYSGYLKTMNNTEVEKTLFVRNIEKMSATEILNAEYEDISVKTISKLLNAYNDKNMTEVSRVDYRVNKNKDYSIAQKYVETISDCEKFRLHDVQVENGSLYSISGYFTYSYLPGTKNEKNRVYASTEYIIKKINNDYVITYLTTKKYVGKTEEDGIKESMEHGKSVYGVENLLNLSFEE